MKPDDREFSNNLVFIASIGNAALKKIYTIVAFLCSRPENNVLEHQEPARHS